MAPGPERQTAVMSVLRLVRFQSWRRFRSMQSVRVAVVGLGWIGRAVALLAARRKELEIVAAVDMAPELRHRSLGDVLGLGGRLDIPVLESLDEVVVESRDSPQVVLLCTSSFLTGIEADLRTSIQAGFDVVSTCEELAFPRSENGALWAELDAEAQRRGVTVLGTGVNPGFAMDSLPLFLTGICSDVRRLRVRRVVDASKRRLQLQKKVGAGLSRDQFNHQAASGNFGHIGLRESFDSLAQGLSFQLDDVLASLEPTGPDDCLTGIHQTITGTTAGRVVLELDLEIRMDPELELDEIFIEADPPVHIRMDGGMQGDQATAAIIINAVFSVVAAAPGLRTARTVPMITSAAAP